MSLMAKLTQTWTQDIDVLEEVVVKNLCGIIASRAPVWGRSVENEIYRNTIVSFGLYSCLVSFASRSPSAEIMAEIEDQIRHFESRLSQVEVDVPPDEKAHHQLPFRIKAIVHSEMGEEAILLDSCLDLATYKLDVRKSTFV